MPLFFMLIVKYVCTKRKMSKYYEANVTYDVFSDLLIIKKLFVR